jgi:hypothetical protein
MARKKGEDLKIPWGTVEKTNSHSPAIWVREVGVEGARAIKFKTLDLICNRI